MNKRILSLVAVLALLSGSVYAYDADGNANTKREIAGAPGSYAYREYQLVRYADNAANQPSLSAGDVVVADCVSDDGITVGLVGATNSTDAVKGVVVSSTIATPDTTGTTAITDFGRRNWGYIQVKGLITKINVTGGGAAGSTLVASPIARYATQQVVTGTVVTAQRPLGFALDASEQGQTSDVELTI